jgi:hypothetical protein
MLIASEQVGARRHRGNRVRDAAAVDDRLADEFVRALVDVDVVVAVAPRVLVVELDRDALVGRGGQAIRPKVRVFDASTAMCNRVPWGSHVTSPFGSPGRTRSKRDPG